jgi:hypothetical protein
VLGVTTKKTKVPAREHLGKKKQKWEMQNECQITGARMQRKGKQNKTTYLVGA